MSIAQGVKKIRDISGRHFPGLLHWCRLPGLVSWAAVLLGTGAGFCVSWSGAATLSCHGSTGRYGVLAIIAGLGITGILVRLRIVRFTAFLVFAFLLCCVHRAEQVYVYEFLRVDPASGQAMVAAGKVCTTPLPYYENFHFLLRVDSVIGHTAAGKLHGKTINCISPFEPPLYGRVVVRGAFVPPQPRRNPFGYDEYSAMMARGIWGSFNALSCEVVAAHRTVIERFAAGARGIAFATLRKVRNFDNRALLQASFLGDTEFLSPYVKDTFRKSGIYHLIAISGLNTAMLISALYFFLGFFPIGRTVKHLACVAALWAYLPFVGMAPSLFRATIMATLIVAALLFEKKNYALHTLGLAGTLWLVLSPESLFGPGYQLSFAATAGLLLLFPVLDLLRPKIENAVAGKAIAFLLQSLFISIASFVSTLPVLLYHFGTISYFGLIANLVAVSAMTVAMWAFFAGLFLQTILPFLAFIPLWVSERFLDVVVWIGGLANHVSWSQASYPSPSTEMIVAAAIALAGIAAVNREHLKRYFLIACAGLVLFLPADMVVRRATAGLEAVRFEVPGVPVLGIQWPDSRTWLIVADAKRASPGILGMRVIPWLRHTGRDRFDVLLLPSGKSGNAAALRKGLPAFARVFADTFSLSQRSCFNPCACCTCMVAGSDSGTRVTIVMRSADTTLLLKPAEKRLRQKKSSGDGFALQDAGALILRSDGVKIRTRHTFQEDHPLH